MRRRVLRRALLWGLLGLCGAFWPLLAHAAPLAFDDTPLLASDGTPLTFSAALFSSDATVISFTFTSCSSICPTNDYMIESLATDLQDTTPKVAFLTFTIDPFTDQPDVLERRRQEIGSAANRTWITGDPAHVFRLLDRFGMRFGDLQQHPLFYLLVTRHGQQSYVLEAGDNPPGKNDIRARITDLLQAGQ